MPAMAQDATSQGPGHRPLTGWEAWQYSRLYCLQVQLPVYVMQAVQDGGESMAAIQFRICSEGCLVRWGEHQHITSLNTTAAAFGEVYLKLSVFPCLFTRYGQPGLFSESYKIRPAEEHARLACLIKFICRLPCKPSEKMAACLQA